MENDKRRKLLILEWAARSKDPRIGYGIERKRALNAISSSGAKILHDSGGRFIVIEVPGTGEMGLEFERGDLEEDDLALLTDSETKELSE